MDHKKMFQEVLKELISLVTTYREWNLNNLSIKDCEDNINDIEKNILHDIIDYSAFSYGDVPHFFDTYILNNTIHKYYYYKYKLIQHSNFNYCYYEEDILLNYPLEVCKDYCEMILNEILQSNTYYGLKHGYYNGYIDEYKLRWVNKDNIPYNHVIYTFTNYIYYYKSYEIIYNKYSNEIKKQLYKNICIEKLNIIQKKMLNELNIDCWKLICKYVL